MFRAKCVEIKAYDNFGKVECKAVFRVYDLASPNGSTFSFVISLGDETIKIGETYVFTAQSQTSLQKPLGPTAGDDGGEAQSAARARSGGSL